MILYRIQVSNLNVEDSWANEWHPTKTKAFAAFNKLVDNMGLANDIHLDEVDVGCSDRANLATALNMAHVNRDVWWGKELKRHDNAQRIRDLEEDLLS